MKTSQPELASFLKNYLTSLIDFRREVHNNPEIAFDTEKTLARLKNFFEKENVQGFDTQTSPGSGILVIEGKEAGETIALRADIDALPIHEQSQVPWKSSNEYAHSCGHDGHQTWLLGTALYFAKHRDFKGRIVFIFQAAEESVNGALSVVQSGIFERYGIKEIFGAHNDPLIEAGKIGVRNGPIMASCDGFHIKVIGKGTHGANPHLGIDPLPAAHEIYSSLQSLVSRNLDANECAVVSVCGFNAGGELTYNIVPTSAKLIGTVRTFKNSVRDQIEKEMLKRTALIGEAFSVKADCDYHRSVDAVINDPSCTDTVRLSTIELLGQNALVEMSLPYMISEDFSCYLNVVPGCFFMIGTKDENHPHALHSPFFDFNDEVLADAISLFIKIAKNRLSKTRKA